MGAKRPLAVYVNVTAGPEGASLLVWEVSTMETLVGFGLQSGWASLNNKMMVEAVRISGLSMATGLTKSHIDELLEIMVEHSFDRKVEVVSQGAQDKSLFIVKSGEATVIQKGFMGGVEQRRVLRVIKRGECFGESALLDKDDSKCAKRHACVIVTSEAPLITLTLSLETIRRSPLMTEWGDTLQDHLRRTITPGWDAVVADTLGEKALNAGIGHDIKKGGKEKERSVKERAKGEAKKAAAAVSKPTAAPKPAAAPKPPANQAKGGKSGGKRMSIVGAKAGISKAAKGIQAGVRRMSLAGAAPPLAGNEKPKDEDPMAC